MPVKSLITAALLLIATPAVAVGPGDRAPAWQGVDLISESTLSFPEVLNNRPCRVGLLGNLVPLLQSFHALRQTNRGRLSAVGCANHYLQRQGNAAGVMLKVMPTHSIFPC